eukprot:jgi/Bigna1/73545/fgenesh1_pg.24_\
MGNSVDEARRRRSYRHRHNDKHHMDNNSTNCSGSGSGSGSGSWITSKQDGNLGMLQEYYNRHLVTLPASPRRKQIKWFHWNKPVADPPIQEGWGIERFGIRFLWSSEHKLPRDLQSLRSQGDRAADELLEKLSTMASATTAAESSYDKKEKKKGDDVLTKLPRKYIDKYGYPPKWLKPDLINRGQEVFRRYWPSCVVILFYISLCAGFSAPLISDVLIVTGYLNGKRMKVIKRLFETGYMIMACMMKGGLDKGQLGWKSVTRVRFLHARVRRRMMQRDNSKRLPKNEEGLKEKKKSQEEVAINQEDMAVTLLAFSYNVIIGIAILKGSQLKEEDQAAYLHVWRYIGFLIGIDDQHNPCNKGMEFARKRLESILMHVLHPDESSAKLVNQVLKATGTTFMPYEARGLVLRSLLGSEWSDKLELPRYETASLGSVPNVPHSTFKADIVDNSRTTVSAFASTVTKK